LDNKIEIVSKGMAGDKKYKVITSYNRQLLLRIADISEHNQKNNEFEVARKVAALGVPVSQPIDFGICNNGKNVYTLLSYYLAASAITSIVWAKYFAPERLRAILQLNINILKWFDNMKELVPTWYNQSSII